MRKGLERYQDITVDSGAGLPVANPKHFPGTAAVASEGSKRGKKIQWPGGELLPNQGQILWIFSGKDAKEKYQLLFSWSTLKGHNKFHFTLQNRSMS